ncbi:ABC transporter permease subunit [Plantactinospora mayteni]|uniref:Polysaccharide ABC transporter ATP-binding protein n=1 Tax=Plantactinospora mayteni TaxID=566021 RepID=A0ABQ4F1T0_9ACTN|nr:ABC transporter permease subunit [Plantactinospora mayteni]GIH00881.1 polysaccharide ABC transporter ATP-binding protein [Plantactinospora mayteni]
MSTRETARAGGTGEDRSHPPGAVSPQAGEPDALVDPTVAPAGSGEGLRSVPGQPRNGRLPAEPVPGGPGRGPVRHGRVRRRRRHRPPLRARLRRDWPLLVMVAPAGLLLLVFHYLPTLGNVVAFQDYNPYAGDTPLQAFLNSPWIGTTHFETLFGDPAFWDALRNTLAITAFQLVFYFPLPIMLAIMLHNILSPRLRGFVQTVVYLPHFFSWVLVVTFFVQMFGGAGLLAQEMRDVGLEPWNIMSNPDTFIVLVTAETVWKDVGWGTIVFLAALSTIDPHLYEASAVDGAGRWKRLWHVTLPGLRPVIVLLLILRLGDALSVGFEQFMLQRDAVGRQAAEVLDTFVYFNSITTGNYGYGAAAGLFKAVVGLVLILAANRFAHALGERGVYSRS